MGVQIAKPISFHIFLNQHQSLPSQQLVSVFQSSEFESFEDRLKFSLTWDPRREKNSKRYSSYSYGSFSAKLFRRFPVTILTKVAYWRFEIANVKFKKS